MGYPRAGNRVRFVEGSGFEMQCLSCLIYVSLVEEEWQPKAGLTRCRSCWREYKRLHEEGRRNDEIKGELKRTAARLRYRFNRPDRLARNKAWRDAHKEHIRAYNKAYRELHKDRLRAQRMAYAAECRDVILAKKRRAYAEKVA